VEGWKGGMRTNIPPPEIAHTVRNFDLPALGEVISEVKSRRA